MSKGFFRFLLVVIALLGFHGMAAATSGTYAPAPEPVETRKPVASNPIVAQPAVTTPAPKKPTYTHPELDKHAVPKPAAPKPVTEKPAAEKPAAPKPTAPKPAAEKPAPKATKEVVKENLDPNALKVAIMLSPNVKADDDKSFIQAVTRGAERAATESSIRVTTSTQGEGQDETAFITSVAESGVDVIIAVSFVNVQPVLDVAEKHPNVKFMVIDSVVPPFYPNVKSIIFREHEGSFLVGMMAALKSKTGKIGFVGGRDVTLIRNFAYGYKQGAQLVNPKVEVFEDMVGTGPDAWDNPKKAEELAEAQYKKGADVVFAAAGASGVGVLKASSLAQGRYSIGVDSNQNGLFPGHVLTSMIKKVDIAVYSGLVGIAKGSWDAGILNLGLKENAVSYAVDEHNQDLLEPGMVATVENARQQIIDGTLDVKMYTPSR